MKSVKRDSLQIGALGVPTTKLMEEGFAREIKDFLAHETMHFISNIIILLLSKSEPLEEVNKVV
jgi:hypothetical protein